MGTRGIPAAIFDFNGTLSDDEPVLFKIFGELFAQQWGYQLGRAEYFDHLAGHSDREIIQTVVNQCMAGSTTAERDRVVDDLLAKRRVRYREIVAQNSPILPATVELVRLLATQGSALAIVTGAQRADVQHVLANSPIPHAFAHVIAQDDVDRGKPDPQGFLLAAAALDVDPTGIVVFEDSIAGIRAARAARMRCIAVCGTHDEATLRAECALVVAALNPSVLDLL